MTAENWKSKGKFYSVANQNIFVIDEGSSLDTIVILHGYPTSSYDYSKILPELSKHYRVVIHDHLGFGFSDKPKSYTYSLIDQADFALQLWHKIGLKEVTILAHDYGTSVAKEILARKNHNLIPLKIKRIFLCNSSMRLEYLHLRNMDKLLKDKKLGRYIARLTNYGFRKIKDKFQNTNLNPEIHTNYDINKVWDKLDTSEGKNEILLLSNFINERYTFWHRWTEALKESEIPIKIIWEKSDPVAIKEIAIVLATEEINENLEWIENERYFSILENPTNWLNLVFNINGSKIS
jgi:pimeloyl-ACP methyl ester carboxylesterase